MSGGPILNRVVKYSEVKFEGYWEVSGGQALFLTPPGFVTYLYPSDLARPGHPSSSSITITRSDGKVLAIPVDGTYFFTCAIGENVIMFNSEPDKPSDAPFQ